MVQAELQNSRMLVTGVTGFVGQAVLERLLSAVEAKHIAVVVRPKAGLAGRQRLHQLLEGPCFSRWRERVGDVAVAAEDIEVIEGDVADASLDLPAGIEVVFHCAATVSFDPPIDEAFTTNLLGGVRLYEALRRTGATPHLVHVSTAYVAGMRKGIVPEAPLDHTVDWRRELDAALAARTDVERASRRPAVLERFLVEARKEHRKAGPQAVATDTEGRRRAWVTAELVRYGKRRAESLGWPDVYTLTKALGERAAEETAGDLPLSIVRPSIVESALRHPYPGWIEGFKMAEPIILAYGRGTLPDFPGIPEGVIDMIPVDLVANALLAVAADRPPPGARRHYHVSSGARNPLSFRELYTHVREYFSQQPLPEPGRGQVAVPEWRFPGSGKVERMLRSSERLVGAADRVIERLPRSERTRDLATRLHRVQRRVEFMRRYSDLYTPYADAEVLYTDERIAALHRALPAEERSPFGFDAAEIDWRYYLQEVHCPSVTAGLRIVSPRAPASSGLPPPVPATEGPSPLAVFDLEGTVVDSNVVEAYVWLRLAELPRAAWPGELAAVARAIPRYLATDRRDRGAFLRDFYRRYEGASVDGLQRLVDDHIAELLLGRSAPAAIRRIRRHRAAGHRTVLITGALEELVSPLRPLFDVIVATRLATEDGRYTGYLSQPPLVGEARAAWLRQEAGSDGIDLRASWAYGDSHSDLPLLAAVGNPVAVNPDTALYRVARRRRWPVEAWPASGSSGRRPEKQTAAS